MTASATKIERTIDSAGWVWVGPLPEAEGPGLTEARDRLDHPGMERGVWRQLAVLLAVVSCACGGESSADGGTGAGGSGGGGNGGNGGNGALDPSLVGTWIGYLEAHQFASGSDAVKLVITDGAPSGSVAFGQGSPPPPASDGDVGYPPGSAYGSFVPNMYLHEGFEYSLLEGSVSGDRVRFAIDFGELWTDWCTLQTPYEWGPDHYECLPNWGHEGSDSGCAQIDPVTNEKVPVDCGKLALCNSGGVCGCTATGCAVKQSRPGIELDLDHQASELDGSVAGISGVLTVRLSKQ